MPRFLLLTPAAGRSAITGLDRQSRRQRQKPCDRHNGATKCVGILRLLRSSSPRSLLVPPRRHAPKPTRSAWMAGSTPARCIAIFRLSSNAGPQRPASAAPAARTRNTDRRRRRSAAAPRGVVVRRQPLREARPNSHAAFEYYTLIIRLPRFSPASNPISACGVFSMPAMTSSCTFSLPAATQDCRSASA